MGNNTNKTTVLEKEDLVKLRKELLGEEEINFHTFLKKRLVELNLQQKHIANMCNVSDKTISKWCSGRGLPDIMTIPILAEALDVSIHTITNSIFGIRDYYTVDNLTSRTILDGAIKEKNEFPDADCIAGAFIGKSEYNLYLLLKHIFEPPTTEVAGFLGTGGLEETFVSTRGSPNSPSNHRCSVGGLRLKINGVLFIL